MVNAFNDKQVVKECSLEPALIFTLIKQGDIDIVLKLILDNKVNINVVDNLGNDVMMRLLKAHEYEAVLSLIKKRNWLVNHQNTFGDTFSHILALDDSVSAVNVFNELKKKKNYLPNIKNKKGETALDLALNNNYLCTAFKILEDKRFNDIGVNSFKSLFNASIKNSYYGKYTKINNLKVIVENLERKELDPCMSNLIQSIATNMDAIIRDIMNNGLGLLENIINSCLAVYS